MDHGRAAGPRGMFSIEGLGRVTEGALDRIVSSLGPDRVPSRVATYLLRWVRARSLFQIQQAVREEMAVRLSEVIRRTSLSARPSREAVAAAARIAGAHPGWSPARAEAEIDDVVRRLSPFGPTAEPAG
jgi:hypothetical protein